MRCWYTRWQMSNALDEPGSVTIVVYDRWTGRFQRAVYDDKGGLNVMGVFTPF